MADKIVESAPMLTTQELQEARAELSQAGNLIEAVRVIYLSAGYVEGARLLNDVGHMLSDEIAALGKAIGQHESGMFAT